MHFVHMDMHVLSDIMALFYGYCMYDGVLMLSILEEKQLLGYQLSMEVFAAVYMYMEHTCSLHRNGSFCGIIVSLLVPSIKTRHSSGIG